jgi:hypothetical protein
MADLSARHRAGVLVGQQTSGRSDNRLLDKLRRILVSSEQ